MDSKDFRHEEWQTLYNVYLAAQSLVLNPKMVKMVNDNAKTNIDLDLRMLLQNLQEYNEQHGGNSYAAKSWDDICERYDFFKNKISLSLQEEKQKLYDNK